MGQCQAYDCAIYDNLKDLQIVEGGNSHSDAWMDAMHRRLDLDPNSSFDVKAAAKYKERVVIRAKVTGNCKPFCFDRGGNAHPIKLYSAN